MTFSDIMKIFEIMEMLPDINHRPFKKLKPYIFLHAHKSFTRPYFYEKRSFLIISSVEES